MTLPKIKHPTFTIEIPSNGKKITLRPFTVKEEKILLMAMNDDADQKQVISAIKQIISNCIVDGEDEISLDDLTLFDMEYIFLNLRANSVDNVIKIVYKKDGEEYFGSVRAKDIQVKRDEDADSTIPITDEYKVTMQYPTIRILEEMSSSSDDDTFELIARCIKEYITPDDVMRAGIDFSLNDIMENMNDWPPQTFGKIQEFFNGMPHIHAVVKAKTKDGKKKDKKELKGLSDFFTS